jgi:2,4-dienoyl-CoA reductase-like NADH-dependent reductase (Old Yellow Enzyme family)
LTDDTLFSYLDPTEDRLSQSLLFTPFRLRDVEFANRIVVSPMGQHSAEAGIAADWHHMHLGQFAVSGAGLVITEAVAIEPRGRVSRGCLGIWNDEQAQALGRIVSFCRKYGTARMGIQLSHSGRKGSVSTSWEGARPVGVDKGGWTTLAPSALAYPGRIAPAQLSVDDIATLIDQFGQAARRAHAAGFDLIELHAAHGYLLHNFLSPLTNFREDGYGGSLQGRLRFVLEIFDAVRAHFPAGKPVGVRVSATDWIAGGWDMEGTLALCEALKARDCDYICVSSGGTAPEQTIPVGPLYQVPFSARIRREAAIPTMAVGLITEPKEAEAVLRDGRADLIAIGRGMLMNPRWAWRAADELGAEADFPPQYERAHPSLRRNDGFKVIPTSRAESSPKGS